ncbi:CRE-MLTN-7 protein [Caenorhabditis remanei]|uniref:CRE-MLTN-7 protein n=1 Tax=Caenorhabditis remanei TaxID=31234 RepID=E3LHP0_CAERE|nr:CRE-MLTN-7 protein [Caenorhabditis remanei]
MVFSWFNGIPVAVFTLFLVDFGVEGSIISRSEATTPSPSLDSSQSTLIPNFPWLENVAKIEFTTSKPKKPNALREGLVEQVRSGKIPKELFPFVNLTKIDEMKKDHNETLDFIIRDEDVADIPDDDDVEHRKVNTLTHDGNKTIITISDEARDDLYKHWMDQSLAGLMGAVVTNVINKRKMTKSEKKEHYVCINESKNVTAHAKCVVRVYEQLHKRNEKLKMYSTLTTRVNSHRKKNRADNDAFKTTLGHYEKYVKSGAEEFRVKRASGFSIFDEMENKRQAAIRGNIQTKKSYTIRENKSLSPLAMIARKLTELVRAGKNKQEPPKRWQQVIQEIKDESTRIKGKKKNKDRMKRKFSKFVSTMKEAGINPRKALNTMGMEDLFEDDPILSEKEMDLKDRKEMMDRMSPDDKIMHEPIKLIREAIKIGMSLAGKNASEIGDKKVALLSPQFMSILPDEVANDTVSLFSPSILALHGEGTQLERQLSLTKALKLMEDTGQEEWMNFVLEASGVTETVDKMRQVEHKEEQEEMRRDYIDKDGKPLYFTKENVTEIYGEYEATKLDIIQGIYKTMSPEQMDAMNTTGYSIMDDKQLEMLYGSGSPYNDTEVLDKFRGIPKESMPSRIEENIRMIAREEMKFELSRKKDIVLSPLVLTSLVNDPVTASQSIILSPVLLAPLIFSPSIYGNVILSPWVFVPVLVSPRILGAVVLSPVVFSPAILTPLCMVPIILSPGVGLPFILSPFILSPFILSPVVMAPLVLSPFALSPFIGIPNALTPLILSPFVLSPLVLSPPFVSAFVLNPYALSPAVMSNGAVFTAVLSPSWLSTL